MDASVFAEYLLPGRDRDLVAPLFDRRLDVAYWLPDHGILEVAGALRKRYLADPTFTLEDLRTGADDLLALGPITVSTAALVRRTIDHTDRLTPYDAAYLVLAQARTLPICTFDGGLAATAPWAGATVLQPGTPAFARWLEDLR